MKLSFALIPALFLSAAIFADNAATTSAPASAPASQTAPAPAGRIAAKDQEALKAAVGKSATVTGQVSSVTSSPSGSINFINFKGHTKGDFIGIIKKDDLDAVNKGFDGDVAKALIGKEIELSGTITDYKGTAQVEVKTPDQIKVVEKTEKTDKSEKKEPAKEEK